MSISWILPCLFFVWLIYQIFFKHRVESKRQENDFRNKVHSFIEGFVLGSPGGASFMIIHIADVELDRIRSLKSHNSPPELGTDPFYYAVNYKDFGLKCVQKYADMEGIDNLFEYCTQFENEVKRS